MEFEKKILILSSELVKFNFDDKEVEKNQVVCAWKKDKDTDTFKGLSVIKCNLDASSFDLTSNIKPNEYVDACIGTKENKKDGTFKFVVTKIKGVEV